MSAPFFVQKGVRDQWGLWMRQPYRFIGWFDTYIEAIKCAHRRWPYWL